MAGDFFFKSGCSSGCTMRAGQGEALISVGRDEVQGREDRAGGCKFALTYPSGRCDAFWTRAVGRSV